MDYHATSTPPSFDIFEFKEKIYEKITKAKAVLTCAMFATEFLRDDMVVDNSTMYHALWVVDEYLDDLTKLSNIFIA